MRPPCSWCKYGYRLICVSIPCHTSVPNLLAGPLANPESQANRNPGIAGFNRCQDNRASSMANRARSRFFVPSNREIRVESLTVWAVARPCNSHLLQFGSLFGQISVLVLGCLLFGRPPSAAGQKNAPHTALRSGRKGGQDAVNDCYRGGQQLNKWLLRNRPSEYSFLISKNVLSHVCGVRREVSHYMAVIFQHFLPAGARATAQVMEALPYPTSPHMWAD